MIAWVGPISTVRTLVLTLAALLFSSQLAFAEFAQQGPKLVGIGAVGNAGQGSVALSADGNTAIVGGGDDNSGIGAAWVFTRSGGVWTQQGDKLVGTGAVGNAGQGDAVALSADGNTAIVGGWSDNSRIGAAWVFTRSGGVWTQQGKLVGSGAVGSGLQGLSVALSADGNTAIVGGPFDNADSSGYGVGAAWVFTRSGGVWTQQGNKLVGSGAVGSAQQGTSVALSADGNAAIVGARLDNGLNSLIVCDLSVDTGVGAAWVFTRSGGVWTQQGDKLVGTGAVGNASQGDAVALSADGNTAIVGGWSDNSGIGAAWVFSRSGGVWTQQGSKLAGSGAVGRAGQGDAVALSADGNTAIVGGSGDVPIKNCGGWIGAAWVFTRSGGIWAQQGSKLVGSGASEASQGSSVALSADGNTAIVGGSADNNGAGAAWVFVQSATPSLQLGPTTDIVSSGNPSGPFTPSSFQYQLSASVGSINYSISGYPNWLTPSLTSGTASTTATSVTFTVNANANSLAVGNYGPTTITFTNTDTGQSQTRTATLTVNAAPALVVAPATNMAATGNQGGPFTPPSFQYQVSATVGSINYSISGYPNWLTPSSTSGIASTTATNVTFTVNSNANSLAASDSATITFTNMDTGQGSQTRMATLTVNPPGLQVSAKNIAASGQQGGPFSPSSFSYSLNAASGSVKYTITNVPKWLTETPASGTATTRAASVTFRINTAVADKLSVGTNISNINFNDTTNHQVTTRTATLTITPKNYTVKVIASPIADGTVTGGGTFAGGTSETVTATSKSGHTFVHRTENGRVVSTSESYTFTVSANVTLVADFR